MLCTDGRNPATAEEWVPASAAADAAAPGFGPLWTWASAPCASSTWTVRDEDAYTGPFTRRTAAPVLVVGNYWDPATNYEGAVAAAGLLPRSSLLSSDSWGHTAYGTSACVTDAVDAYLLTGQTPAAGTVCTGDVQPFTEPLGSEPGPQSRRCCSVATAPAGGAAAAGCGSALLTAGCPDRAVRRPVRRRRRMTHSANARLITHAAPMSSARAGLARSHR